MPHGREGAAVLFCSSHAGGSAAWPCSRDSHRRMSLRMHAWAKSLKLGRACVIGVCEMAQADLRSESSALHWV